MEFKVDEEEEDIFSESESESGSEKGQNEDEDDEIDIDADLSDADMSDTEGEQPQRFAEFSEDEEEADDDDEEDELNENYLQKLDHDVKQNIISDFHPELNAHSMEEVEASCTVIRDDKGTIIDPLHRTLPFVTRYEKARVIGERAKQINSGAKPFIEIDQTMIDGYLIALKEFEAKKIPFIIRRPLPNGNSEYWRLIDLEIIA